MPEAKPASNQPVSILTGEPFHAKARPRHRYVAPAAVALGVHAVAILVMLLGFGRLPDIIDRSEIVVPTTLVFRMEIGPGGGGGGGGEASPEPASIRKIEGEDVIGEAFEPKVREPLVFTPEAQPREEPEIGQPAIEAPFAASAPDDVEQEGVIEGGDPGVPESSGPGTGGGAGTGTGAGSGPGEGSGVGEGSGTGFGGGAHQLGTGVEPPVVVRSVQPDYTEDALRRKLQGDVVLQIVILPDGRVGEVLVVRGLDPGLDQNAIAAASKWWFVPGKIQGEPVAVIAEVVMEFRLR